MPKSRAVFFLQLREMKKARHRLRSRRVRQSNNRVSRAFLKRVKTFSTSSSVLQYFAFGFIGNPNCRKASCLSSQVLSDSSPSNPYPMKDNSLRRDFGVKLTDGTCRGISRIRENLFVSFLQNLVETFKLRLCHVNLAANFQTSLKQFSQCERNRLDSSQIMSDILPTLPSPRVAPRIKIPSS